MRPIVQCMVFWLVSACTVLAASPGGFETKARQIYMIEASTGTVLISKDENEPVSPASLAKLMTMEVVFQALKTGEIRPETAYPVSEHAWRTGGAPSRTSTMFAALKSSVPVIDLVQGVIVQLANDACIILAEGISGSEAAFAQRMSSRAGELGLTMSKFANPTGLPDTGNRTTMRDMVMLAQHLQREYPEYYRYYAQPEYEWNRIRQRNKNPLISANLGIDGLATGFADGEGFSIVLSAERNGKRIFLAMGGLQSDKERQEEARRVVDWAMSSFENRTVFRQGEVVGAVSVYGGARSTVDLIAKVPVDVFVPVSNPERLAARIVYRWPLTAPVEADREVGTLKVSAGERVLREVPLYTADAVEQGTLASRALDAVLELMFFWL